MLADVGINYIEESPRVINNNYRNIICLVAPFKDDSFVFKTYNSLKEAVKGEKTLDTEAKGYQYLALLYKYFPEIPEIVLCNTTSKADTTGNPEDPQYDYSLTNDKLAVIFDELDEVGISFLVIPEELSLPQYVMYKTFYDDQRKKMNAFGLFDQIKPTTMTVTDTEGNDISETPLLKLLFHLENMEIIDDIVTGDPTGLFATGGSWATVTTPLKMVNEEPLTMEESVVYFAGLIASLPENISGTHLILEGVEGQITKCVYDKDIFDLINLSGALAVNYRDKIHDVVQIYNSGTKTWNDKLENTLDLKHERVHALIMNELRVSLLKMLGKDKTKTSYDNFESLARNIRDKYMGLGYISGLDWEVKEGKPKLLVPIEEKQKNIISTIDVSGILTIE